MRFGLLSIVELREQPFVSLLIYETDEQGISALIADIIKPYGDFIDLLDDLHDFQINQAETDSQALYRDLVNVKFPVIYRREIEDTRRAVKQSEAMLVELYELDKEVEQDAPVLPAWRLWCIDKLERLIKLLQTKGVKTNAN
ncbi:hypothetical protein [Lysinibacillus antri]|uniref:Uncharacterized protein n=1 Tax=Lysinibacillus antri TaxID=2498145 RepID=A0A3S0RUX8_9BACI|nr:hypothetical protein [Lysinibacillus antri]RUL51106.1 hypothetical protein EK386_12925 [Lysinibacillus antri]